MTSFFILLSREVRRFLRVLGQTVFTPFINSLLYLLIFGVSIGRNVDVGIDVSYLAFLIPGLVMMGVLNNAYQNAASSLMISKYHGDLEDLKITPLSSHHIVWAMSLASVTRGMMVGAIVAFAGELFFYIQHGSLMSISQPLWVFFFLLIGGLSFAQIGIAVGLFARTFDHMNAFGSFILLPLIYLGGVFFSLDNLHPSWRIVSQANPLLYYINGMRYAFINFSDIPVWTCAQIGCLFLLCCSGFAYLAVKKGTYQRF